jgi:hypothetical protein
MSPCSPAQGAMYAPLALKFVFSESPIFFKAPVDFLQSSCHPDNGESFDDESYNDDQPDCQWDSAEITHRHYYRGSHWWRCGATHAWDHCLGRTAEEVAKPETHISWVIIEPFISERDYKQEFSGHSDGIRVSIYRGGRVPDGPDGSPVCPGHSTALVLRCGVYPCRFDE